MMRIDAHQHYWEIDRGDYGWLTPDKHPVIARNFLPPDLVPHLTAARIDATILVQAAPTIAETDFLLDIAAANDSVAGVVGWVDFESEDVVEQLTRLTMRRKFVGVRPMVQDIADPHWLGRPALAPLFDTIAAMGLRFDALVKPVHLSALAGMIERHPALPVVIDHLAKPDIAQGEWEPWADMMRSIARNGGAHCKLSGLPSEAGEEWNEGDIRRYVDLALDAFGADRVMWGSDWPVVEEASDYARWHEACRRLVPARDHDAVFGGTAARFYGLGGGGQ